MNKTDLINRKNLPVASTGTLKYGRGDVVFETNGEIAVFEIGYIGAVRGVKKLGKGWIIKASKNKIVVFSTAQVELSELLFTYVGELKITSCKCTCWNKTKFHANIQNLNRNDWNINYGEWGSDARKYEEIETEKIIRRKVRKTLF